MEAWAIHIVLNFELFPLIFRKLVLFLVFQKMILSISTYIVRNSDFDLHLKKSHTPSIKLSYILPFLNISVEHQEGKRATWQ